MSADFDVVHRFLTHLTNLQHVAEEMGMERDALAAIVVKNQAVADRIAYLLDRYTNLTGEPRELIKATKATAVLGVAILTTEDVRRGP